MARSNREAQENRSKSGISLELEVARILQDLGEDPRLDGKIEIVHQYGFPIGRSGKQRKRVDFAIVLTHTKQVAAFVGCKASLRERGSQDAFLAWHLKTIHPFSKWIEVFRSEHPGDTVEEILGDCDRIADTYDGKMDLVVSVSAGGKGKMMRFLVEHIISLVNADVRMSQ